jgi:biotin synthase
MAAIAQPISRDDVKRLYEKPLLDLVFEAATTHRAYHNAREVQLCSLLSIRTGACPEDCKYCAQSLHNPTGLQREPLMELEEILSQAREAKAAGSTRFCMGASWRAAPAGRTFDHILEAVRGVRALGMEACVTLGMLSEEQARRLKEAGLDAYNHNLDTSESYYGEIVTTHKYQDRLDTIANVTKAGISVCCGGILGMGETLDDRIDLLCTLANLDPQPESVPINALVPIEGAPLCDQVPLDVFEWLRAIAVARVLMPKSMVRLSAGRLMLSREAQALAFLAGANAIFVGDKLLTTANPGMTTDQQLLDALGLLPLPPNQTTLHG